MGKYLVVGLGNPGKAYERTRHNVGFEVLDRLAKKHGLEFRKKEKFKGSLAEGSVGNAKLNLLKPHTFMNESGQAIAVAMPYLQIDLPGLLVVVDDVDLPFGKLRLKTDSGPGTHNGLKSVAECLQTNGYARLRVGVGAPAGGDLADYVLDKFSPEEEKLLPEILERAVQAIETWFDKGLTRAMDAVNPSNPSNGEK